MSSPSARHFHDHHIAALPVAQPEARIPTDLDEYLFDLHGFLILRGVLSKAEVADGNARMDAIPRALPRGGWHGWVQRENHPEHRGASYQQVYELGGAFERMIDHPAYLNYVLRFIGGQGTYDYWHGSGAFIDENFVTMRGPGDGATMVIPGSHKSNIVHPAFMSTDRVKDWSESGGASADNVAGAIEVHMEAGDAIVFVDATCHGSATRVNPGERRHSVYRYGSAWNRTRFGYHASPELLARLNPVARKLVHPQEYIRPPGAAARW